MDLLRSFAKPHLRDGVMIAAFAGWNDASQAATTAATGGSMDPELAERLARRNIFGSRYEGPTGIVGVLGNTCREFGLKTASLWGSAPHYVSPSNPKVTAALLHHLDGIFSLNLD